MHKILFASKNSEKIEFFREALPTQGDTFKYFKNTDAKNHSESSVLCCSNVPIIQSSCGFPQYGNSPMQSSLQVWGRCNFVAYGSFERWVLVYVKGHSGVWGTFFALIDNLGDRWVSSHHHGCRFLSTKPFYCCFSGRGRRCCIFCSRASGLELHLQLSWDCYIKVDSKKLKLPV